MAVVGFACVGCIARSQHASAEVHREASEAGLDTQGGSQQQGANYRSNLRVAEGAVELAVASAAGSDAIPVQRQAVRTWQSRWQASSPLAKAASSDRCDEGLGILWAVVVDA